MSARDPKPAVGTAPAVRYRLDVVGGAQRGARALFDVAGRRVTLGSGPDNDIVLLDPQVERHALTLSRTAAGAVALEAHAEGVLRDGEPLERGTAHPCRDGHVYAIGTTRFTLTPSADGAEPTDGTTSTDGAGKAPEARGTPGDGGGGPRERGARRVHVPGTWSAPGARDASGTSVPVPEAEDADASAADAADVERGSRATLARILTGIAALVCVSVGISWLVHRSSSAPPLAAASAAVSPALPSARERLARSDFDSVAWVDEADGSGRVAGVVESRRRLHELQRLLRGVDPPPRLDVRVQSEIVDGVRDVYRTNGLDARVESGGPGIVRVVTAVAEPLDTVRLETAAMSDVPGLAAIETRNDPPAPAPVATEPPRPVASVDAAAPGKRVVAVVQGDPSYIVTEDDSRYFVGSSLPSGHTIAAIENETVTLERQGQRTRLDF